VRVWDAQTRQALRVLQNPAKGPVTSLLVLDRPPHLAAGPRSGGGRSGGGGGGGSDAKRGPARPAPLAAFARYPAEAQAWEGVPCLIDGSQPHTYETVDLPLNDMLRLRQALYSRTARSFCCMEHFA